MNIDIYTGGIAQTNGYLIQTEQTNILFDAPAGVYEWLQERDIEVSHVILTHQHWDHSHDLSFFKEATIVAFADHSEDLILQNNFKKRYDIPLDVKPYVVTQKLAHNELLSVGDLHFKALHVPGHSPDSIAFYNKDEQMCIGGDVLFYQSCGRVDLPGGNAEELVKSIEDVLFTLPPETTIFPGHGPETSIEEEMESNPYKSL
ncbi:MBL fold metallo-hydrolase [Akkermansiaceae bacterium]|nr:MBL fold metallo-hydrolase [Akkermansiaceae bacterium]